MTADAQTPDVVETVVEPTAKLLRGLYLLGTKDEMDAAGSFASTFAGPPQHVALIEAGVTAGAKWWSAGLAGLVGATWSSVVSFWSGLDPAEQRTLLWIAGIVTAAALIAIAHLLAADLNSRGLAAVAGIRARAAVAEAMLSATSFGRAFPLPIALAAESTQKARDDDVGWVAVAMRQNVDHVEYLLIKDHRQEWTRSDHVVLKG